MGTECCYVSTFSLELQQVISLRQIELREILSTVELKTHVFDGRYRVTYAFYGFVRISHIHTDPNTSILFRGLDDRGHPRCWLTLRYTFYDVLFFELFDRVFYLLPDVVGDSSLRLGF